MESRSLSAGEIDLMGKIDTQGAELQALLLQVNTHISVQQSAAGELIGDDQAAERARLNEATPARWAALGRTHLQQGLMELKRAIGQRAGF